MGAKRSKWKTMNGLLNSWYGRKRASLEMLQYLPQEKKLGDAIQRVMKQHVDQNLSLAMDIKKNWSDIAGGQVASVTFPYKLDGRFFIVQIKHPVWMQELKRNAMDKILVEKINAFCGKSVCERVVFVPYGRQ